jgi:hypothetical protein
MTYLDTRELQDRIDELEEMEERDEEDQEELDNLLELKSNIGPTAWKYGVLLIPDSKFEEYAEDTARDISGIDTNTWPFSCIDWSQAAEALQMDYSRVEYDNETYWYRE